MDGASRAGRFSLGAGLMAGLLGCLSASAADHPWERRLAAIVDAAAAGQREAARRELTPLLQEADSAPLARALLQDLQRPHPTILSERPADPLLAELRARWRHQHQHPAPGLRPLAMLAVADHHRHVVLVDIDDSRLYLYARRPDGRLELREDHYVTVGKNGGAKTREGDGRTPIGVYRITGFIPPQELSPFYGAGALPLTYPNRWDRLQGRTGSGIWIHGNPIGEPRRPPRASDGCVTLANEALESLRRRLDPGTPVIIAQRLAWRPAAEVARLRDEVLAAIEAWRRDWASLDTEAYLTHYAADFTSARGDLDAWRRYKRRVNAAKRWIRVEIADLDLFLYPGEADLVQAVFSQDYRSSNYRERSVKEMFWRRGADGRWRIVYEGSR